MKELKYDAFISYRHCEVDQFVAEILHKQLEAFRLPKNILKKRKGMVGQKTKISRVFRDCDELPIASNLSDPITLALLNSEFLIVICSPRLKDSVWCQREIETFIKMHDRDHILAVLVEGEPADSFPEIIRYQETESILENGTIVKERKSVEPLAADVRGNTKKEIRKKIKEEVVRLAAPMFGCGYDELKQRHKEQKIKRIVTASLAGAAVCLVFGLVSSTMALMIHQQSKEISSQADIIEKQYEEAMVENAKAKAKESTQLLESGDRIAALQLAYDALPTNLEAPEFPYTSQAQYALTNASNIYRIGEYNIPSRMLHHGANVEWFLFSPEGDLLLTVQSYGEVAIWDTLSGEKITTLTIESSDITAAKDKVKFIDNNRVIYPTKDGFAIYNLLQRKEDYQNDEVKLDEVKVNSDATQIFVKNLQGFYLYNANSYERLCLEERDGFLLDYDAYFTEDSTKLLIVDHTKEESVVLSSYDYSNKSFITLNEMNINDYDEIQLLSDSEMLITRNTLDFEENKLQPILTGEIYYLKDNNIEWTFKSDVKCFYQAFQMGANNDKMVVRSNSAVSILERQTGKVLDEVDYGQDIVNILPLRDSNCLLQVELRDGSFYIFDIENRFEKGNYIDFHSNAYNIKQFDVGRKYFAQLTYNSPDIILYTYESNQAKEKLLEFDNSTNIFALSGDGKRAVNGNQNDLFIYDVTKSSLIHTIKVDEAVYKVKLIGEQGDKLAVITYGMVSVFSTDSGKLLHQITIENPSSNEYWFHQEGTRLSIASYKEIFCYDLIEGKEIYHYELEDELKDLNVVVFGEMGQYFAIASKQENKIKVFHTDHSLAFTLDVPTPLIKKMFFDRKENRLFVRYANDTLEVYDLETKSCIKSYTDLGESVVGIDEKEDSDESVLYSLSSGYVINQENEVVAKIDYYKSYCNQMYYLKTPFSLVRIPEYQYKDLLEYARKQLPALK